MDFFLNTLAKIVSKLIFFLQTSQRKIILQFYNFRNIYIIKQWNKKKMFRINFNII